MSFLQDTKPAAYEIPAYRFWSYYIKNGIEEGQHQWCEVPQADWAEGLTYDENDPLLKAWRAQIWDKTLRYIKDNLGNIDLFLCYLYPQQIETAGIQEIRKLGIPCINFYCDNVRQFNKIPAKFMVFDLVWVPEYEALPMYQKAGIAHIHLPMPMWVHPKYRNTDVIENEAISFIGSKDVIRERMLSKAIQKGLPLQIRGAGWMNEGAAAPCTIENSLMSKIYNQADFIKKYGVKGFAIYHRQRLEKSGDHPIPAEYTFEKPGFDDYIKISRESCITLGINSVPTYKALNSKPLAYSRLRDIEAPMLGACYLTQYTEGLKSLYYLGEEIETYSSINELLAKYKELKSSPSKRASLRKKGQQRALNSWDIPSSLQKIKQRLFS